MDFRVSGIKLDNINCKCCGKEFEPDCPQRKYCTKECARKQNYRDREDYRKERVQKLESKIDSSTPAVIELTCKICNKAYKRYRSQIKWRGSAYCSKGCKSSAMKTKKGLKRTIDKLWADIVKVKAGHKCEYIDCEKTTYLNSHHIFSRSNHALRWNLENGVCLCAGHHILSNMSAHKAPLEFAEWLKEYRGIEWYERLRRLSRVVTTMTDYDEIKKQLYTELEKL
jgi:hypothetical protein